MASPVVAGTPGTDDFTNRREDYALGSLIGKGATAAVYAGKHMPTKRDVAVKCIHLDTSGINIEEVHREIRAMESCHHTNVVRCYTSFVHKHELWLIMNLLTGGSALDIMKAVCPKGTGFSESILQYILRETLKGIEYFHKNNQIHRDIKGGNILIGMDGTVQLGDFGVSASLTDQGHRKGMRKTFVGTPCWMAPEVAEMTGGAGGTGYDCKADIWSFGITAMELATGAAPLAKYDPIKALLMTISGSPPRLEDQQGQFSSKFKKMVDMCMQRDPTQRPSATELLKHAFFSKTKDKKFLATFLAPIAPVSARWGQKQRAKSGKLVKTESGGWDFEEDSDGSDGDDEGTVGSTAGTAPPGANKSPIDESVLKLKLRIKDEQTQKLKDIRFEYVIDEDDATVISSELAESHWIAQDDVAAVSGHLAHVVNQYLSKRATDVVRFTLAPLSPGHDEREVYISIDRTGPVVH